MVEDAHGLLVDCDLPTYLTYLDCNLSGYGWEPWGYRLECGVVVAMYVCMCVCILRFGYT